MLIIILLQFLIISFLSYHYYFLNKDLKQEKEDKNIMEQCYNTFYYKLEKVDNPKPYKTADDNYYKFYNKYNSYYFTEEATAIAKGRGNKYLENK